MYKQNNNWWIHILLGILFLLLSFVFTPLNAYDRLGQLFMDPFTFFKAIVFLLLGIAIYLHHYILIPKLLEKKLFLFYFVSVLTLILIVVSIYLFSNIRPTHVPHLMRHEILRHHDHNNHFRGKLHFFPPLGHVWQMVFIYSIGIILSVYFHLRQSFTQMKEEHAKGQILHLTSQINPHFLFNTFNSIYGLAIKEQAKQTADGMLKLSDLMRYVVSDSANEMISLKTEVFHIENYIALQKLRLAANVKLVVEIMIENPSLEISPMLLIPFIENAFKHGVNPDQHSLIEIWLNEKDNQLNLGVRNYKVVSHSLEPIGMNIGIQNTIKRLQLIYPSRHEFLKNENDKEFSIKLTINLSK